MNQEDQEEKLSQQTFNYDLLKTELILNKKNYENKLKFLQSSLENWERQNQFLQNQNETLTILNTCLNLRITEIQKSLLLSQQAQVLDQSSEYQQLVEKVKQELETSRDQCAKLKRENKEQMEENSQLKQSFENLSRRADNVDKQNCDLQIKLTTLISENEQKQQKSQLGQSSGSYKYYVPQDSKIQEFENLPIAQQFKHQLSEGSNHFVSYPIEDLSGNIIGISFIQKQSI